MSTAVRSVSLPVQGMSCASCVAHVEKALKGVKPAKKAKAGEPEPAAAEEEKPKRGRKREERESVPAPPKKRTRTVADVEETILLAR